MPPYISARLRLLFSPPNPSSLFLSNSSSRFIISPRSFFPIILSSSQPPQRRHQPFNFRGRGNSTVIHTSIHHQVAASMDDNGASVNPTLPGFNKRRAEGRDKTDRPKNLQLKVRKLNPTNTISYVQILGTGMDTQDTSPSVLLFFDKQRFIFNAGEVNLWGPSNLKYLVDAMKCFIPHAAMVHTRSFGSDMSSQLDTRKSLEPIVLVDDEVVKISALLLRPQGSEGPEVKPGDMSVIYICELPEIMGKFDPGKAKALGLRAGPKYGELQKGKSVKSDRDNIMVHPSDVMDPPVPGPIIFLVDCPTEAHVQDLLSTESLDSYCTDNTGDLTEDDKSVNCIVHLSPSSVIISPSYQKWMSRFSSAQQIIAGHKTQNVEIPILKSSARVAARLNYLCPQFFPAPGFWSLQDLNSKTTDSSFSVEELPSIANERISAENLLKFTLRPHAQLGLDKANIPSNETPSEIIGALIAEIPEIVDAAKHVGQFWDEHGGMGLNLVQDDNNMTEEPWLEMKRIPSCLDNVRRDDLEIVLLGTGSSQPSKYRNVSSVYINLFSKGSLLLDCGEGTLGQLKRRYGLEGADNAVRNLSCVWISHIHADHHTGLARILALRRALLQGTAHEPLLVVGPGMLRRFLVAYQNLEDLDFEFLDCRSTTTATWDDFKRNSELKDLASVPDTKSTLFANTSSHMQSYWKTPGSPVDKGRYLPLLKKLQKVLNEAGLESLISFPVVHCPQAFGVALKSAERKNNIGKVIPGWKIVYSGDTRPCLELEEASHEATVLIHEATFEDGLMEEAVAKNHSTTKEAIQVGVKAGAYRIILTHFSQRYPKIPLFDDAHMHKTCIAFDLMSVNLADLPVLPSVLPYLKLLFKDEMVVDESDDVPEVTTAIA
ncbi:tRNAse Z TRZ4, mitochondrial [Linum perenne]